jgi:hypothetical protein
MRERVLYNSYYQEFDDFRSAVMGFFSIVSSAGEESELGKSFIPKQLQKSS